MPAPTPFPAILMEDDTLVAFDKPAGLPMVPERSGRPVPSLMGLVRARFGDSVANVHRLDTGASGVVLCAKTKASLDFLSGQFQSKTVDKAYVALCVVLPADDPRVELRELRPEAGSLPPEFLIDAAIGEDEHQAGRMRLFRKRGGKPSTSQVRVLESFGRFAWVECRPLTGRTHQVRVHLAAAGVPVLNDALYGDPAAVLLLSDLKRRYKGRETERPLLSRLALHASGLGFQHPSGSGPVSVASPLPEEFEIALKYLRKFSGPGRA